MLSKHKKNYTKFFRISEGDIVYCEVCGKEATEIHHIEFRSHGGNDEIENLIALCRECHSMAHNVGGLKSLKLSKQCLRKKHKQKISAYLSLKYKKQY